MEEASGCAADWFLCCWSSLRRCRSRAIDEELVGEECGMFHCMGGEPARPAWRSVILRLSNVLRAWRVKSENE